jgi:HSP20 family protein
MADRQSALTRRGEERDIQRPRPSEWSGSPFHAIERFADDMDRMFDRMFEDFGFGRRGRGRARGEHALEAWTPQVDVVQKDDRLTIRADLPGLSKEDIKVEVTDTALTMYGERRGMHEEEQEGVFRRERTFGTFYRTIPLPEGALTDQAKAEFRDGVLEITIPAPPASKGRRLQIG